MDRPIMSWQRIAKAPNFPQRVTSDRLVLRPYRYGYADDIFLMQMTRNGRVTSRHRIPIGGIMPKNSSNKGSTGTAMNGPVGASTMVTEWKAASI
jgi:hypothetical protein